MTHDDRCERARWRVDQGCECASRAYNRDPLPTADLPVLLDIPPWVEF
jgi:hypothetical protein